MSPEKIKELLAEGKKIAEQQAAELPYPDGKRLEVASNEKGLEHTKFFLLLKMKGPASYTIYLETRRKDCQAAWDEANSKISPQPLAKNVPANAVVKTATNLVTDLRRDPLENFGFLVPRLHGNCIR